MRIETSRIPTEGLDIESEEPASIIEMDTGCHQFSKPITLKLRITLRGQSLYIKGQLSTLASLRCDRCLKWFEYPIVNNEFVCEREVNYPGEIIDLTESISEDIILCLPFKILCREKCKGFCPKCGQNLNEDRCDCREIRFNQPFAALDKLKIHKEKKKN